MNTEAVVIGGGPAGLVAGALLAVSGVPTVLLAPPAPADTRTTALMHGSLGVLGQIGVWPKLAPKTGALRKLRLVDDSGSLVRAPETLFDAAELGLTAFGHNIANTDLLAALRAAIDAMPGIRVLPAKVRAVEPSENTVAVHLEDGRAIAARLAIGADGRQSLSRAAAGIDARTWDYPQSALTLNFAHSRPHGSISTEFHRRGGPLVLVPLPGDRSSIVLVDRSDEVERLAKLDTAGLGRALERATHGLLGRIEPDASRGSRPLGGLSADSFAARRIALVGEAAHVLPPIGAQGLNLGIRDAAEIARFAADALVRGKDPGTPDLLAAYDRARRADANPRLFAVDALNRSLVADLLPLDAARALGLWTLSRVPPLRRAVMRRGIALPNG